MKCKGGKHDHYYHGSDAFCADCRDYGKAEALEIVMKEIDEVWDVVQDDLLSCKNKYHPTQVSCNSCYNNFQKMDILDIVKQSIKSHLKGGIKEKLEGDKK